MPLNEYGEKLDSNGYAPSILHDKPVCLICGRYGTARHEVYFGSAYRAKSKRLGLWVTLCPWCHQNGPTAIHNNRDGATISAKNVKHLAIPLNMEAKNAGSPRKFNDLRFIPISPGYGFLVRDRKHPQKAPGRKKQEKHDAKKHPSGGEEDPRPNEDYEWMYMLVDSVTIPERSFIRASFDTGKATLENICKEAVDGIILKKWTAQEAADYIGKWAVEMTHDYFNTKLSPPKSATTQLTSTQYQPLFDTGRLYNSISYSVEGI